MRIPASVGAAVAVVAMALSSCGADDPSSAEAAFDPGQSVESLEAKANEEGSLVLYSAFSEGPLKKLVDAFAKKYPEIDVQFTRKATAELMQQFTSEAQSGINAVDVVTTGSRDPIVTGCEEKQFADISGLAGTDDFPEKMFDGCSVVVNIAPWGIWWNTDEVSADEAPKGYADLLDAAWSDRKLGLGDPGNTDTYIWLYTVMEESVGGDFLKQLRAQEPAYDPSMTALLQSVASGSLSVMCCKVTDEAQDLIDSGAPIDGIVPTPTMGSERTVGVAAQAPHPNAALLFVHWMMTPEGQQVVSENVVSPLPDIPGTIPPPEDFQSLNPELANPNGNNGLRIRDALGRP